MATDMPADMPAETPAEVTAADERWRRMWSHREHLLKVARRRSMSPEDAEDAVHEAMLRAAERPDLDEERLAAWLTTVTMRLCVDRYRQVNREAEVRTSPTLITPGPVPVEEAVCDRAEAKWLAVRSGELPARQAEALRLKSEDLDVGQVAVRMGLSYRTVESLLARARRTLRQSLAATLGFALFLIGWGRPRGVGRAQAVAVASTAASLAVAGFVLPYALDGSGDGAGVVGRFGPPLPLRVPRRSGRTTVEGIVRLGGMGPRLRQPSAERPNLPWANRSFRCPCRRCRHCRRSRTFRTFLRSRCRRCPRCPRRRSRRCPTSPTCRWSPLPCRPAQRSLRYRKFRRLPPYRPPRFPCPR